MKKIISILFMVAFASTTNAQTIGQRINQKVKNRVNQKVDQSIDKGLDKTEKAAEDATKKKNGKQTTKEDEAANKKNGTTGGSTNAQKNTDFVPGNKLIFADDFSQDATGDFPAQWNTNGAGEVTTIKAIDGKWLSIAHNSIVNPELKKSLPENCTIEFDLFLQDNNSGMIPRIEFGITPVKNILQEDIYYKEKFFMGIARYNEKDGQTVEYGLRDLIGNKNNFPLTKYNKKILHVAMAINNTRIRVYLDGEKLIDLPRALTAAMRNNFFINNVYTVPASELSVLVSNVRIAAAETDVRSSLSKKLMEEGSVSTSDILFDVNKDIIKSSSYAVVDEIGEAFQQNASLKISIIGHTDADGDAKANKLLSEKRAAAVKKYIQDKFKITSTRIQTEGMGEDEPVATNSTTEGKAKNRRVEFVKL